MNTKKKRTPNQKKKAIVSVLLMVAILITGAFAFLSATDSKTNVFTVGNVKIKLSEEFDTNQNGSIEKTNDENDEVYDASETQVSLKGEILPGQKVIKRPYVENTGKNKAWVYITVGIPTTTSDNTFRNKDTGETSITGQNVDIPIQAYAIQENYANKTTYKDVWNAYFADKVTDTFGAEVTDAKTLSERVPLFEILNKTRFNEPIPDNISVDDNIPNDDWENIGITVDGQEKSYYKSANYDYYVFAYKTLLDPTADGAEQLSRTSDVFEGVRLLKDIGEAQPSKLNYYVKETAGDTLNGEIDLSVEASTYDGYRLVKTEYYMPGERVRNLYYDDTLAETGYSFNWNFMNDKTKSAYSGMIITEDTDLVATYEDTVSNTPKEPTEVPVIKYSPSGYLGYAIEQNDDGSYYATLIGADETRSDYPEAPTEVLVPNAIKILENSDGTKLLENGVIMHGSIDNFPGGTQIPVKKIQLAEWQWDSSTMNYVAPEAVALGKIAKKLNISGTNIEEIRFCGDIYQHNITSGFVLEDIGTLPSSLTTLNNKAFYSCVNLKNITLSNFLVSVGLDAFEDCKALEAIDISNSVKSIGSYAFEDCTGLTSIAIPDSVKSIGSNAFESCISLKSITIPEGIKEISDETFKDCTNLTSLTIPASVTNIGIRAFDNCKKIERVNIVDVAAWCKIKFADFPGGKSYVNNELSLYLNDRLVTNLIIPNKVTKIEDYAFSHCTGLTSVTIPDSVTSIGQNAFDWCTGLTNVTIGKGVTSIDDSAFAECTGLTSVTIPDSVTSIGNKAFWVCSKLTKITIPNSVTSIGDLAFNSCFELTNITIPDSVTIIGKDAFSNCRLTSVTIPSSVTSIGENAFDNFHLKEINVSSQNKTYASKDGILYTKDFSKLLICPPENTTENLVLPEGLKEISDKLFRDNFYIKTLFIPSTVTKIGDDILSAEGKVVIAETNQVYDSRNNCNAIIETATNTLIEGSCYTIIPNSVENIGDAAFAGCFSLTSVTIPDSVKNIGNFAFKDCSILENITMNKVVNIGQYAFRGCSNLKSIEIPDSVTTLGQCAFYDCDGLTSVIIGNGVTCIDSGTFIQCSKLSSLVIGSGVKEIKPYAFQNSIDLNSIVVDSNNLTYNSKNNCNAVIETATNALILGCKNTVIPDSVKSIGKGAFLRRYSKKAITIPDSVTSIGESAFKDCSELTSVTLPNSVTSIGSSAFQGCTGITSIILPDSITSIGYCAFQNCANLLSITIPNMVTQIDWATFQGCVKLTSVTIPKSVTYIVGDAFENCPALTNIIYQSNISDWAKVNCPPGSFASGLTITCTDGTVTTQ